MYLIEIETYADRQIDEQIMDDVMLIYQARRVVPEVVLIVLRPKGQMRVLGQAEAASASGRTRVWGSWPVVELWTVPAESMLALNDPGVVPWIALMESARPPEQLLKECRQVIDEKAKPEELGNILAVSQILAGLRYNERWLFDIFGGKEAMIESPYFNRIIQEQAAELLTKLERHTILRLLKVRFGPPPTDIAASLEILRDMADLESLADWAETCPDLDAFRQKLPK